MADIKICYFDARGLAEVSRLVLTLAGQKFEDIRWTREDWPKYKPEAPFGQGPYLVYNGKKIGQSAAMACFLAREFGLYGKTNSEAAVVDQVIHIYRDMMFAWQKVLYEPDEAKKAENAKKIMGEEGFPKYYGHFAKLLKDNGNNGHFIGDSITLADLYVYDSMFQVKKVATYDAAAAYPELKKLYDIVDSNPKIQAYVAQRKDTPM